MKVGIVCYPTFGGSGVVATELGLGLAQQGHEIHFITYRRPARLGHFQENVFYHEVDVAEYPLFEFPPYETALAGKLVDVVRFENLDLLHVHYAIPHAAVAYLAKKVLLGEGRYIPVITTLHGTDITLMGHHHTFKPVIEFSINKSDGVTAVSQDLRRQTQEFFRIDNEIRVIPNFIDFGRFRRSNKEHFRKAIAQDHERIVIHVSNFRKVKRLEDVIAVFARIHARTASKLLLIGDGPERWNAENISRNLGLCDHVRFLGKQDAIEELMAVADLFLLTSEMESFGLAALEAMACEVPVISTDAGGLPEVNIHGVTGFVSAVGDVEDMARNALHILTDDAVLATFRVNALAQARRFDVANILPVYEEYYREVLARSVVGSS